MNRGKAFHTVSTVDENFSLDIVNMQRFFLVYFKFFYNVLTNELSTLSQIDGHKWLRASKECRPQRGSSFIEPCGLAFTES